MNNYIKNITEFSSYTITIIGNPFYNYDNAKCEICKTKFLNNMFYIIYFSKYLVCAHKIHMNDICSYNTNVNLNPSVYVPIEIISAENLRNKNADDYKDYLKTKLKKSLLLI